LLNSRPLPAEARTFLCFAAVTSRGKEERSMASY
jgi:hypothetical protein